MVIPVELRRELGIEPGEQLVAHAEDGRLVLERRDAVLGRLQALFAHLPADLSLADELIADRRAEARRELPGD
jgi:bifunctional DNA-binding transcriptional regulator/antitoxin component of YhaV-PrlF toxin-antitoxin module